MLWKTKKDRVAKCRHQEGFSLVEAMVATALMAIGFAGSYTLTAITRTSTDEAIARQKLQLISNQIYEVIESDLDNLDSYDMDLKTCNVPDFGETDKFDLRQYEWCMRMAAEVGAALEDETRQIDVTTLGDGRKVVHIDLEARNQTVSVVMKRTYSP